MRTRGHVAVTISYLSSRLFSENTDLNGILMYPVSDSSSPSNPFISFTGGAQTCLKDVWVKRGKRDTAGALVLRQDERNTVYTTLSRGSIET